MIKKLIPLFILLLSFFSIRSQDVINIKSIKIAERKFSNNSTLFKMGTAAAPDGTKIGVTSRSLTINDSPVIPVMGEIHYARVPDNEWEKEILKMKAGGITVIATYVFWIHHEEIRDKYNWAGQRDIRKFISLCAKHDMPVVLRLGPWCHGECRNGGFPEWLVESGIKLRTNNEDYLRHVRRFYDNVYEQIKGCLWKDGGPVIGVQIENEYRGSWENMMLLKDMICEIGFDTPLYTRTGWPKLGSQSKFGEILPLYGDYADGFWDRNLTDMPGDYKNGFRFRSFRNSTVIATEQLPKQSNTDNPEDNGYPFFTCELGGGMMTSYHRRINIDPMDIYSIALIKLGSGSNLPGYYMYHGGTNPEGKLTTMNEEQDTKFTNHNDLPVKTYDFQAPIGEFGQINHHYHLLRRMHIFLKDFGSELALMSPFFPASDDDHLRWSVRSDGKRGFVFVNNYERLSHSGDKKDVVFDIELPSGNLTLPSEAIDIPQNSCFFMPFNMDLGGVNLKYSTAQPVTKITDGNTETYFFKKNEGVTADFVFDVSDKMKFEYPEMKTKKGKHIHIKDLNPQLSPMVRIKKNKKHINIVLLDEVTSLNLWKGMLAGKERVFITDSELTCNGNELEITDKKDNVTFNVFPMLKNLIINDEKQISSANGIFQKFEYEFGESPAFIPVMKKISDAGELREIINGKAGVAESPKNKDFENAAVYRIVFPDESYHERDLYLNIPYEGDVARIYSGNKLLADNFYNGKNFEFGLKRNASQINAASLMLKILPLQKDAPIYIQEEFKPDFKTDKSLISVDEITVYEKKSVKMTAE